MQQGVALFLEGVDRTAGLTRRRDSLESASALVARTWSEDLLSGYRQDPAQILAPLRTRSSEGLIAARDIEFSSICLHHLLPFQGKVHIAYAPDGRITGLSRLGRLVDCLSRRLQLQESLTRQIVDAVQGHLAPSGAACVIEASHTCVTTRGACKPASRIVTAAFSGTFKRNAARRREAMVLLGVDPRRVARARSH